MSTRRHEFRKAARTPEQLAELRAIRAKYQREKPTPEQVLAESGQADFIPIGELLLLRDLATRFRHERERAGLSLAEVAERAGMDPAALSRLESGKNPNPTLDTLYRVAAALGKTIRCTFEDAPPEPCPVG